MPGIGDYLKKAIDVAAGAKAALSKPPGPMRAYSVDLRMKVRAPNKKAVEDVVRKIKGKAGGLAPALVAFLGVGEDVAVEAVEIEIKAEKGG